MFYKICLRPRNDRSCKKADEGEQEQGEQE
jgi:hypothetical protein